MSLWKFFMIIFGITSVLFYRCASYDNFGVRNMANSDVRWALLNAGGRKTFVGQVSESKSTVSIPPRGLFYPDDMFFTNWVSGEVNKEDCSADRPTVTTPLGSISKCTLKTNNDEKPTKYKTTIDQQKSTFSAVQSLSGSPQKSTLAVVRSSPRQHKKSSLGQQKSTALAGHQNPTSDRQKSTRGRRMPTLVQNSSAPRLSTPRVQLQTSKISDPLQKSSRGHRPISTTSVQQQKSTSTLKNSSRRPQKSSSRVQEKSSREQRKPMRKGSSKSSATTTFSLEYYYPDN